MILKTVEIESYKSIKNQTLHFTKNCIGLVGVNESGKTNVLDALASLSEEFPLDRQSIPKTNKATKAKVNFCFELEPNELSKADELLAQWLSDSDTGIALSHDQKVLATYSVSFEKGAEEEVTKVIVSGYQSPPGMLFQTPAAATVGCDLVVGESRIKLGNLPFLSEQDMANHVQAVKTALERDELSRREDKICDQIESRIEDLKEMGIWKDAYAADESELVDEADEEEIETHEEEAGGEVATELVEEEAKSENSNTIEDEETTEREEVQDAKLAELEQELGSVRIRIEKLESSLSLFDFTDIVRTAERKLQVATQAKEAHVLDLSKHEKALDDLPEAQKVTVAGDEIKKKVKAAKTKVTKTEKQITLLKSKVDALKIPLEEKYSNDENIFLKLIGSKLASYLESLLPEVVCWRHSKEYVLQGESEFESMLAAESLSGISRPLVNLFRIGTGIRTLEDLKETIREIQSDGGERSRYESKMNEKIDRHLKSVWKNYDQEIKISIEQERIRVEFFDPKCREASYYKMKERSQGCQTFVSFLLTIGAEAKRGVISNTLLLLDEPEQHLHPSGARYMLQELVNMASNNNKVVFATHSVFMIDSENYERHFIVEKEKELTKLKAAKKDRIGYFMQEEVLYSALEVDINNAFGKRLQHNFVFEGHGDAVLFEAFYRQALRNNERPFQINKTSFHQGGKCSDIIDYFAKKPIRLGSTWVFIIDGDKPADALRDFLNAKYKDFIGKYIFVMQYSKDDEPVVLEDLLEVNQIQTVIGDALQDVGRDGEIPAYSYPFDNFFDSVAKQFAADCEEFKPRTKELLNSFLLESSSHLKNMDEFEALFPTYSKFANEVISELKPKAKPSKKTENE